MIEISIDYVYRSAQLEPTIKIISRLSGMYSAMENKESVT